MIKVIIELRFYANVYACKIIEMPSVPQIGSRFWVSCDPFEEPCNVTEVEWWENFPDMPVVTIESNPSDDLKPGLDDDLEEDGWTLDHGAALLGLSPDDDFIDPA